MQVDGLLMAAREPGRDRRLPRSGRAGQDEDAAGHMISLVEDRQGTEGDDAGTEVGRGDAREANPHGEWSSRRAREW
ncbi:hypothetical protein GCM10010402_29140 [Actinomadura luteofluorescens]